MARDTSSSAPIGREDPEWIWDKVNEKYPPKAKPDPVIAPVDEPFVIPDKPPVDLKDPDRVWVQMKNGLWYNTVTKTYHASKGGKVVPNPDDLTDPKNPRDVIPPEDVYTGPPGDIPNIYDKLPPGLNIWELADYIRSMGGEVGDIADPTVTMPDKPGSSPPPIMNQAPKMVGSGNKSPQGTQVGNQRAFQPFGPGSDPLGYFSGPKGYGNMQAAQASALRNG
jgi:hypothetical protein